MKVDKHQILLIRLYQCRQSDMVEQSLKKVELPFRVKYYDNPDFREIIEKFRIKVSPGIVVGEPSINPYDIIGKCKIKNPEQLERHLKELLRK